MFIFKTKHIYPCKDWSTMSNNLLLTLLLMRRKRDPNANQFCLSGQRSCHTCMIYHVYSGKITIIESKDDTMSKKEF
jgi:hypothetical protein